MIGWLTKLFSGTKVGDPEFEGDLSQFIVLTMKPGDKRTGGLIYGTLKRQWDANENPGRVVIIYNGQQWTESQSNAILFLWKVIQEEDEDGEIVLINAPKEAFQKLSCIRGIKFAKLPNGLEWKRCST